MKKLSGIIFIGVILLINIMCVSASADTPELTRVNVFPEFVVVEGFCTPGVTLSISADGNTTSAVADSQGFFTGSVEYSTDETFVLSVTNGNLSDVVTVDGAVASNIDISYDNNLSVATLVGTIDGVSSRQAYVIYSIHGTNSTISDVYAVSDQRTVMSGLTQSFTNADGSFAYEYEIINPAELEHIYIVCGGITSDYVLDTNTSISYATSNTAPLHNLPQQYEAYDASSTKENFENVRSEIPDEMPVVQRVGVNADIEIFVSNVGSDTDGDGSIDAPYASVEKAVSMMDKTQNTVIYLRGGTYFINQSVELCNITRNLMIMPYHSEKVTITNGIRLSGSEFEPSTFDNYRINKDMVGKIWQYDLSKTGIGKIDMQYNSLLTLSDGSTTYDFARWPDGNKVRMKEYTESDNEFGVIDAGPYLLASEVSDISGNRHVGKYGGSGFEIMLDNLHPFTWDRASDIFMCGSFYREFTGEVIAEIGSFNAENQSVRAIDTLGSVPSGARYDEQNAFYYFNVLEELNMEKDWCIDTDNMMLYVYPSADIANLEFNLSVADNTKLFSITNSKNVTISGIEFSCTSATAISVSDSQDVIVQDCAFKNLSRDAVLIEDSRYSGVIHCDFKDITYNAVKIKSEASLYTLTPDYNFVQNNTFYNCNSVSVGGVGVIVSHNLFSNMPEAAVYLYKARECVVEYNEFLRTPTQSVDMGAIYFSGYNKNLAHHIRYNYLHQCDMDRDYPSTIYPDELASYNYIYGNILEGGARIHLHCGSENTVYNNIIVGNNGKVGINDSDNHIRHFEREWESKMIKKSGWCDYLYPQSGSELAFFDMIDKDAYETRYPHYMDISAYIKQRADEFRDSGLPVQSKSIYAGRPFAYNSATYVTYSNGTRVNLDIYLRAPRDNYYANNAFINSPDALQITSIGKLTAEISNNADIENPFNGNDYADERAYDKIRETIPGFETIPFDKIGIKKEMTIKGVAITYPQNGTEFNSDSVAFKWTTDLGAAQFVLEISDSSDFSDTLYSYDCYRDTMEVDNVLTNGTYYVRVTANPEGTSVSNQSAVSDVVQFKVADNSSDETNVAYITDCEVDELTSEVSFNYYNANTDSETQSIFVASYLKENLIKVEEVDLQGFDTLGRVSAKISPDADSVAVFNWLDTTLIPLCRKKLITIKPLE